METFSALLAICAGNCPVPDEFPTQRPVTRSFDVFFDVRLNKRLSKQWWFETLSHPLWRHRNAHFNKIRGRWGIFLYWYGECVHYSDCLQYVPGDSHTIVVSLSGFEGFLLRIISMAQYKTAVTPLLTHWSYCSLALSHRSAVPVEESWIIWIKLDWSISNLKVRLVDI